MRKLRRLISAASFNWARGSRIPDNRMSPMLSSHETVVDFHGHRQQLFILTMNLSKIPGKQYYLAGQWEIPKWLAEPSLEDDWDNPDVSWILAGMGDLYNVQEAHGFEEDGAIAKRLGEHGIQTTYFKK